MRQFEENKKAVGAYVNETFLQYRVPDMSLVKRRHKRGENKEILVSQWFEKIIAF